MRKLMALAVSVFLLPAFSQAASLEDLLVEKGVITKSEARAAAASGAAKVYYHKGTRLDFADTGFTMKINSMIQPRYEFLDGDGDAGMDNTSSFTVRRARLKVSGTALHEEFSYRMQVSFNERGAASGERATRLLDADVTWHMCDNAALTMGQFKVPVSRQYTTSAAKLQFPDRSEASNYYDLGRHAGLKAVTSMMDDQVIVGATIVNGTSDGEGINRPGQDTKHGGAVMARADLMGSMDPFVEGDVDYTEDAALNVGAIYFYGDGENDLGTNTVMMDDVERAIFNADVNFKYQGISLHGEFYYTDVEADVMAYEYDSTGFYLQGGYFFEPKKWEVAARYGYIDCDNGMAPGICAGMDNVNEVNASLNYYWWKHNLKAQLGYSFGNQDPADSSMDDINTNLWVFQLSSWF